MTIENRSRKYVEFHMFETFDPVFIEQEQLGGTWHTDGSNIRYESIVQNRQGEIGANMSYLFPNFDPDDSKYDNYNSGFDD